MAGGVPLDLYLGRVSITRTQLDAIRVIQVQKRGRAPQISKLGEIARDQVINSLVLRAELIVHAGSQGEVLPCGSKVADLDSIGLRLTPNEAVKDNWPVYEREVVIMGLGEPTEVGEEAPTLHGQIIGQRGGDNGSLFNIEAVWRSIENRIAARERINVRGNPNFG